MDLDTTSLSPIIAHLKYMNAQADTTEKVSAGRNPLDLD